MPQLIYIRLGKTDYLISSKVQERTNIFIMGHTKNIKTYGERSEQTLITKKTFFLINNQSYNKLVSAILL